jgi:hypothetical protein
VTPSSYRAYAVTDSGQTCYTIERIADQQEVMRISGLKVEPDTDSLSVEYQLSDRRFLDWFAVDLIFEVLLAQFLQHEYKDKVSAVVYRNTETESEQLRGYGTPEAPARPR